MSSNLSYSDEGPFFKDQEANKLNSENEGDADLVSQSTLFNFPVQGNSVNLMVDACENLIALILRVESLKELNDIESLHRSVIKEVEKIELSLRNIKKYDDASLLTCRYCLCTVVDEAILNTVWGKSSLWSSHSLLSTFHGETWGGEKFYKIIERLLESSDDYQDLLQLLYIFLCLGYQGRYGVDDSGTKERRLFIEKIYSVLPSEQKQLDDFSFDIGSENTVAKGYKIKLSIPSWLIYVFGFFMLYFVYLTFDHYLDIEIENILEKLKKFI